MTVSIVDKLSVHKVHKKSRKKDGKNYLTYQSEKHVHTFGYLNYHPHKSNSFGNKTLV